MLIRSLATDAVAEVDDEVGAEFLKKGWVAATPRKADAEKAAPRKRAAKAE